MSSFEHSLKNIKEIERVLSSDRFETYLKLAGNDKFKALEIYKNNIKLSQQMYAVLHILEICLRNKIDEILSITYGENWYLASNLKLSQHQIDSIQDSWKENQKKRGIQNIKRGHLIASLTFGFWTSFFDREFEELWRHSLRKIFILNEPILRKKVAYQLQELRILRNRIAHHECILRMNYEQLKKMALYIISNLSSITADWLKNELLGDFHDFASQVTQRG